MVGPGAVEVLEQVKPWAPPLSFWSSPFPVTWQSCPLFLWLTYKTYHEVTSRNILAVGLLWSGEAHFWAFQVREKKRYTDCLFTAYSCFQNCIPELITRKRSELRKRDMRTLFLCTILLWFVCLFVFSLPRFRFPHSRTFSKERKHPLKSF